jgi:septal ring factor EnvC (AmiA/AmiB activator)
VTRKQHVLYLALWIACFYAAAQLISSAAILVPVRVAISVAFIALARPVANYLLRRRLARLLSHAARCKPQMDPDDQLSRRIDEAIARLAAALEKSRSSRDSTTHVMRFFENRIAELDAFIEEVRELLARERDAR